MSNKMPQYAPRESLVDHHPPTPGAFFDVYPVTSPLFGPGIRFDLRHPDGSWEFLDSYLVGCLAAGLHRLNPVYMPGLYDKHKKGAKKK